MKMRSDFVTNSSSSNFVIAFKDSNINGNDIVDRLNKMSKELLDSSDYYETEEAEYFSSVDSLLEYLHDRFYDDFSIDDLLFNYDGNNYTVDDIYRYLANGYKIAIKKVSYYNDLVRDLIYLINDTNNCFVVLNNFD